MLNEHKTRSYINYSLELQNRKRYLIRVLIANDETASYTLWIKIKDGWRLFATCGNENQIEHTIKIHFGFGGRLQIL